MTFQMPRLLTLLLTMSLAACGGGNNGGSPSSGPAGPSPSPAPAPAPAPAVSGCVPSVGGMPISVPGAGSRYTLTITTGSGCAWSLVSDAGWATVSPGSGAGSGSSTLVVEQNTSVTNSRSANLTIGGQVLHFSQATACSYKLDETTVNLSFDAGTLGIQVTAPDGCAWTASATETWLSIRQRSGSGTDTVRIDVAMNTGGDRHATVTIGGQRVTVNQAGR